jgi:hypothetical protein
MATVNLTWTPGSGGGAVASYTIYRRDITTDVAITLGTADATMSGIAHTGSGQHTHADPDSLTAGPYSYSIYAINAAGESPVGVATDGPSCANVTVV